MNTADTVAEDSMSTELYAVLTPQQMRHCRESSAQTLIAETPQQRYLFLKLNRAYAERVAKEWSAPRNGAAYVVRLSLKDSYLENCRLLSIAYAEHEEYRIPVSDLPSLYWHRKGVLTVVTVYWDPKPKPQGEIVSFG